MKVQIGAHKIYFIIYLLFMAVSGFFLVVYNKQEIHLFLNDFHQNWADFFFKYLTDLGDGLAIVVISVLLIFVSKRMTMQVAFSGILAGLIAQFLKKVVFGPTPRPSAYFKDLDISLYYVNGVELHTAFSFPSGHATTVFSLLTSLVLIQKTKRWDLLFIALAMLTAYSRIYLSQHFLEDIFLGSIIGTTVAVLISTWLNSPKLLAKKNLDKPLIKFNTN